MVWKQPQYMNGHCYVPIKLYLQNRWQARFGLWTVVGSPSSSQVQWSRDLSLGGVWLLLSYSVGWKQCVKDPVCHRIETQWFQLISNTVICHKAAQKCVPVFFFFLQWVFIAAHGLSLVAVSEGYSLVTNIPLSYVYTISHQYWLSVHFGNNFHLIWYLINPFFPVWLIFQVFRIHINHSASRHSRRGGIL